MPISDVAGKSAVVGRLAPSPTGAQHLGNARTFLVAWLMARSMGGRVILRVEDIDSPRVKPWAVSQAIDDLRWLGLDWDEGPDVGGPNGPYLQTERAGFYDSALLSLMDRGLVYPCTCTRRDIEESASAPHEKFLSTEDSIDPTSEPSVLFADGPIYPGTCSRWNQGDAMPVSGAYCWRFRCPNKAYSTHDSLRGKVSINPATSLGDFPLTRKNGQASYQLAVVLDDAAMGINQVVRGDDLLPSVFRQLPLIEALGLQIPTYVHIPLVIGPDGRRLAKRHGDTRLSQYRTAGISPARIIGWAAHSIGLIDRVRSVRPSDLLPDFDITRIARAATQIDPEKLFCNSLC